MERNASVKNVSVGEISGPLQPQRTSYFECAKRRRKMQAGATRPVSGTVSFQGHRKQPEEVGEILMWPDSARQGLDLLLCIGFTDCN